MVGLWSSHRSVEDVRELAFMNTTDIYRQAIKRVTANSLERNRPLATLLMILILGVTAAAVLKHRMP